MNTAVEFCGVDILFTRHRGREAARRLDAALTLLDGGASRAAIADQLGVTVGVAGADLKVRQGEISVLMGLSGSGKSTLLRAANGLNRVTRGHVMVRDGEAIADVAACDGVTLRRLRRRRIAMVFQQFGLLPWRSVRDNVGLGLELRGEAPADRHRIVAEKLELVGLSQWADRHVSELSGGMQQRVGLARAFATDADVLLMDEPFSALDPLIRTRLQDELLSLQQQVKKTILFVSHDLDEALRLGNQISILEAGRIVQTGTVQDIVLRPASARVSEFVQHMNPLTALTGAMVMRPQQALARTAEGLWLDARCSAQISVGADGQALGALVGGRPCALIDTRSAVPTAGVVALAPASISLLTLIRLHETTGHPVVLIDNGQVCGVCAEPEIMRALAGTRPAAT